MHNSVDFAPYEQRAARVLPALTEHPSPAAQELAHQLVKLIGSESHRLISAVHAAEAYTGKRFDPRQRRDDHGRWSDGGSGGGLGSGTRTLASGLVNGIGGGPTEGDLHKIVAHQWDDLDGDQHNAVVQRAGQLGTGFLSDPQPADLKDVVGQVHGDKKFDADTIARSVVNGIRDTGDRDAMRTVVAHHYPQLNPDQQDAVVQAAATPRVSGLGGFADAPPAKEVIAQLDALPAAAKPGGGSTNGGGPSSDTVSPPGFNDVQVERSRFEEMQREKPVYVGSDVNRAADLLAEGKRVELHQPDEATILLDTLAKRIGQFEKLGQKAPTYDLCKVSVKNTNLFCAEAKGIERIKMPQLGGIPLPGSPADKLPRNSRGEVVLTEMFVKHLGELGYKTSDEEMPVNHMRPTQMELNGKSVAGIMHAMEKGVPIEGRIPVSNDNYILDGHHRWAAKLGKDARDGTLGDVDQEVARVDIDIITLLNVANQYAAEMGMPQRSVEAGNPTKPKPKPPARRPAAASIPASTWTPPRYTPPPPSSYDVGTDTPDDLLGLPKRFDPRQRRDRDGQWTDGGGGPTTTIDPADDEPLPSDPDELAAEVDRVVGELKNASDALKDAERDMDTSFGKPQAVRDRLAATVARRRANRDRLRARLDQLEGAQETADFDEDL